jgi:hypothetical protein
MGALLVLVAGPYSMSRHWRQAETYQPRDGASLTAAVRWLEQELGDRPGTVLTTVRDGKWLEGLTGRAALFSQPVRYAFRPVEWQRSVDAEALLRSTAAMTNEFFFLKFIQSAGRDSTATPTDLVVAVNHGGEFADVLRIAPSNTTITAGDRVTTLGSMVASGAQVTESAMEIDLRSSWSTAGATLRRHVSLVRDGATLQMTDAADGHVIATELLPVSGMSFASVVLQDRQAQVCLTRLGLEQPCMRVWVAQEDAVVELTPTGGLRIETVDRMEIHLTALTAGGPSTELAVLRPADVVSRHDVVGAILYASDPAFPVRRQRLEALGFEVARSFGPYQVMVLPIAGPGAGN